MSTSQGPRLPAAAVAFHFTAAHTLHAKAVSEDDLLVESAAALLVRVRSAEGAGVAAPIPLLGTTAHGAEITRESLTGERGDVRIDLPPKRQGVAADADGCGTSLRDDLRVESGARRVPDIVLAVAAATDAANELSGVTLRGFFGCGTQSFFRLDSRADPVDPRYGGRAIAAAPRLRVRRPRCGASSRRRIAPLH